MAPRPAGVAAGRPTRALSMQLFDRLMRSKSKFLQAAALVALSLLTTTGCTDRLPTLTGAEQFPGGVLPTTIQLVLPTGEFLQQAETFRGLTGIADATALVVARDFDGGLNSHALARLRGFPDTVIVRDVPSADFEYQESTVLAQVPNTQAVSPGSVSLQLWAVTQPWDSAAVNWEYAVDRPEQRVRWQTPGGTRGELVSTTSWARGDAAIGDTVRWSVPGRVVQQLANGQVQGLLVTLETGNARIELGRLALDAQIRSAAAADTIVTQRIVQGPQTFVFTPAPPFPQTALSVGGLTSDRTLVRIGLGAQLPACPPGTVNCPMVSLNELTLNRVELLLDPVPVPLGFRPVAPTEIRVRRLLQPELGDRAPLGNLIAIDSVPAARFAPGGGAEPVALIITSVVAAALARGDTQIGLAVLVEPEAGEFSYQWFSRNPRLRFVYTLPRTPQLP
jgi:hypothetical protein